MILPETVDKHINDVGDIYAEFRLSAAKIVDSALLSKLPGSVRTKRRTKRALRNLTIKTQERIAQRLQAGVTAVAGVSLSEADAHLTRTGKKINRKRDYRAFESALIADAQLVIGKRIEKQVSRLGKRYDKYIMGLQSENATTIDIHEQERKRVLGEFSQMRNHKRWSPKDRVTATIKSTFTQAANIPMVQELIIGGEAKATILKNKGRYDYDLHFTMSQDRESGSEMHGILSKGLVIPL